MEIGIDDDLDYVDDIDNEVPEQNEETDNDLDNQEDQHEETQEDDDDVLSSLLRSRGIEDKSKIKFATDDGDVEEVDWNSLSNRDKLNILNSSEDTPETGLDDSEIQLINTIRNSGMNPAEYLQYVGNTGVQNYIQNNQQPDFEIDQYTDDELFLMDLMSRTGEITEDEAIDALEKAKANETLYQKQVDAIRNEYKQAEQENLLQAQAEQEEAVQQQYAEFSNQIVDEINNLTEIQGFDLNMEDDDMQTLYDFITGQDAAGNNYFAKALSDPRILVKTAWLALNGDQMINDITNYFQKEISSVRKESYKKGVADTQKKMNDSGSVVYKSVRAKQGKDVFNDLDDF